MKSILFVFLLLYFSRSYAQTGINTRDPKARLHIEPSSSTNPTGSDGILIPRVNKFPAVGTAKGQLVYVFNNLDLTIVDGFYIWDGVKWDPIVRAPYIIEQDESLFVATGTGFASTITPTTSNSEIAVSLDAIIGKNLAGFSVASNTLIIGKSGKYFVNFISGLKTTAGTGRRATFIFRLKKNGASVINTSASIPNESITASNVTMSNIITLNAGDQITVTVTKVIETNTADISYSGFGINTIKLTFLHD